MRTFLALILLSSAIPSLLSVSGVAWAQAAEKKPAAPKPEAPAPKDETRQPEAPALIKIEKSSKPDPCIIKPVMTDKELRDCGAQAGK